MKDNGLGKLTNLTQRGINGKKIPRQRFESSRLESTQNWSLEVKPPKTYRNPLSCKTQIRQGYLWKQLVSFLSRTLRFSPSSAARVTRWRRRRPPWRRTWTRFLVLCRRSPPSYAAVWAPPPTTCAPSSAPSIGRYHPQSQEITSGSPKSRSLFSLPFEANKYYAPRCALNAQLFQEPWLLCLMAFHVILLLTAVGFRRNANFQLLLLLLACEFSCLSCSYSASLCIWNGQF